MDEKPRILVEPDKPDDIIRIGKKIVEFRKNDFIFKLTEQVMPKIEEERCIFCNRDMN